MFVHGEEKEEGRREAVGGELAEGRKGGHEAATEVEELGQKSAERKKRALEFIVLSWRALKEED